MPNVKRNSNKIEDYKAQKLIQLLKNKVNEYKDQIQAIETNERRLKEQLIDKDTELEEERQKCQKLVEERLKYIQLRECCLKSKDNYEKRKNNMIKEMMEKEEQIHNVTKQLNELKKELRKIKTDELENQLKELSVQNNNDRSIQNFETNEHQQKNSRSRSPFLNDNTISETVMYGGTSVLESIIGSFPNEK
jgi:DNA-binding FrmR family transcriptional regulator